jgi:ABC-type branched-subunit amino acid transport system substrate-binding protein
MSLYFMLIIFSACTVIAPPRVPEKEYTPKPESNAPASETTETKPVVGEKVKDSIATAVIGKSWAKKDRYTVSFVLPFSVDEAELYKLMGEDKITGYQPLASLEFYEGALLALDTLEKLGYRLNIQVYNSLRDSLSTSLLLQKEEFKKTDLIIGPIFNDGLKAAVPIAAKNEVFLVSPLSPTNTFTDSNKYFIMANPPIESQLSGMIDYVLDNNAAANFIVVYRNDKPNELKIATDFKKVFEQQKAGSTATLKEVSNYAGVADNLSPNANFVFVTGNDELYINGLIRDLSKISRSQDVTLIGLQNVLSLESVSLDYFENLRFQYPTGYWVDQNLPQVKEFNTAFEAKYATRPSDYAYRGYDIMMYFGTMLHTYGPDLSMSGGKVNPTLRYLMYPLEFKPLKLSNGSINFIENSKITILKYEGYRFQKAN